MAYRRKIIIIYISLFLLSFSAPVFGEDEQATKPDYLEDIISFKTADGVKIIGSFYYPDGYVEGDNKKYPAVLLFHMWKRNRKEWAPIIPYLRHAGYSVLTIDFRRHGDSRFDKGWRLLDNPSYYVAAMINDAFGAYNFLCAKEMVDQKNISVIGASIGTILSIKLCAKVNMMHENFPISSMALISPAQNYFGIWVDKLIYKCRDTAILFVMDKQDPSKEKNNIYLSGNKLYNRFEGEKASLVFDGAGHGTKMFSQRELIFNIVDWLNKNKK